MIPNFKIIEHFFSSYLSVLNKNQCFCIWDDELRKKLNV